MKLAPLAALLAAVVSSAVAPSTAGRDTPPWQRATEWPDRMIVTLAADPARSFSVTWRTDASAGVALAQIARASADARFDLDALTVRGVSSQQDLDRVERPDGTAALIENDGLPRVHYHSVTFRGLEPDTAYAYRVRGTRGKWSAWRQVRTAPLDGPIQFLFFGDAQTAIRSHITRVFDTAGRVAPAARFAIHAGDLVNTAAYDQEWAEWFEAVGDMHRLIPALPVPGNHDYINFAGDEEDPKLFQIEDKRVSPLWRPQFTLPVVKELPQALHETVYDIRYTRNIHVFAIDSSGTSFDAQMAWLGRSLDASDARWKIVTMHHPLFSFVGGEEHPSARERRFALLEIMRRHDIDLILTGHRHTYQRGAYGDDVARHAVGSAHDVRTMLIVTASSTKRGQTKREGWDRYAEEQQGRFKLDRHGDNTPIFAVFDVAANRLEYQAVDALGEVYDAFALEKDANGRKRVVNGAASTGPLKTYESTGPYREWNDLR